MHNFDYLKFTESSMFAIFRMTMLTETKLWSDDQLGTLPEEHMKSLSLGNIRVLPCSRITTQNALETRMCCRTHIFWSKDSSGPGHVRGDYLHLQRDGHLTLYRKTATCTTYDWRSQCAFGNSNTKIASSDGDVHQFREDGSAVAWALLAGEEPLEPVCFSSCA
jgi:hypothetical protein